MNLFQEIKNKLQIILADKLADKGYSPDWAEAITIEPPRDVAHGDMATNAAMVLAKRVGMNPRALAELLLPDLSALPEVSEVSIAGPGFINLRLDKKIWQEQIKTILNEGNSYGNSTIGKHRPVNLEYVSANPTGPMHIGHARGAVVGDALARLLIKAGFNVTKEYYINDAGAQVDVLARSAHLRYREAAGEKIEIPAGLYPGEYLKPIGEGLFAEYERDLLNCDESEWLPVVRSFTLDGMMVLIRSDLLDLGIEHDVFFSEKSLHEDNKIAQTLELLQQKGLVYRGVLEPPKGKLPDDWEAREQLLFKTCDFGDDCDRPLQKSDGSYTYFAADVAYTADKLARGFDTLVLVLGADHGGYVKRMEAAVAALSDGKAKISIQLGQIVKFLENGVPAKMSKRAGTFTTVRDVLDAVGKDVLRFIMLTRKPEQMLDFDLVKVTENSRENPVFYVQYAYARCRSVLRLAQTEAPEAQSAELSPEILACLDKEPELALIRVLAGWPRLVESAAEAFEPHRVAYYLHELASALHGFWNLGSDDVGFRFIRKDAMEVTIARLNLARAVCVVIASGLNVLGVEPLEELR